MSINISTVVIYFRGELTT